MYNISTFEEGHQDAIIKMILNIQQNEFQVPITIDDQPDLMIIPAFYQSKKGNFWVALHENEVIGTIALIDCGEGVGTLRKMFVKKEFRGKEFGIGQKLWDTLKIWAEEHDYKHIYLGTVEKLQAAIRFYEKNGFTWIEKASLPESFPIMEVDTHFYQYQINSSNH